MNKPGLHTPGPWHVEPVSYPERAHPQVYAGKKLVAEPTNSKDVPAPESDHNARLIAAAPDLLEVAEKLVAYRDRVGPLNFQLEKADDFIRMLRAAIEKAKGGGDHSTA